MGNGFDFVDGVHIFKPLGDVLILVLINAKTHNICGFKEDQQIDKSGVLSSTKVEFVGFFTFPLNFKVFIKGGECLMNVIHGLIFLIFKDGFSQECSSKKEHDRFEHFGSEVGLVPREILIDFGSFLWGGSVVGSGDGWLSFVEVDEDGIALSEFELSFGEEGYFSQWVFGKVLFSFLLSAHEVDGDEFALDLTDVEEGFDCTTWLGTHVPVEDFLLLL